MIVAYGIKSGIKQLCSYAKDPRMGQRPGMSPDARPGNLELRPGGDSG